MIREEFAAPDGWKWNELSQNVIVLDMTSNPNTIFNISKEDNVYKDSFEIFINWLEENDLKAVPYQRHIIHIVVEGFDFSHIQKYITGTFQIFKADDCIYSDSECYTPKVINCAFCNAEGKYADVFCQECGTLFYCLSCARNRPGAFPDRINGLTSCEYCGVRCECSRFHSGYLDQCEVCAPIYQCSNCMGWNNDEPSLIPGFEDRGEICLWCRNTFCQCCESFSGEELTLNSDGERFCHRCTILGKDGDKEIFDENSHMAATKVLLPTIEGREMIRLSGVEIEGGLGKTRTPGGITAPNYLAKTLYNNGLSGSYQQEGYHHGQGFARVETDASCDWECVIGPINMADITNVRNLNNVVKIIKDHIKNDYLKLDLRCGTHIHVGAERVSLGQAYNLHLLYTFMEDTLYRLGAAHWPIHRILIHDESHSAKRSPKETGKTKFARRFHSDRYYGLSFNNYFERMLEECRCGASRYGAFEECTCNLHKCTFEFRLFNSTANTIKLHAYLALCQALVAKAISMPEIKDSSVFEAQPFVMQRFRDMGANKQKEMIEQWDARLRYIATDLPLTDDEKKSIYYCIKNSELAKVDSAKSLFVKEAK